MYLLEPFDSPRRPHRVPGATKARVDPLEGSRAHRELRKWIGGYNVAVLYVTMTAHTPHFSSTQTHTN
ncbi:hypothetical protein F4804DRAFT_297932 [Jackrogersella minutella]|nr:hypothetical protein F4804DRAFT_297932 [Jackrogersella minutella]